MIGMFKQALLILRDGLRLWWLAPLIPLIAVGTEFAQHVVEVQLGMYASEEAFTSLTLDPQRLKWGGLKIGGLLIAMTLALRYWGLRASDVAWWSARRIDWRAFLLANAIGMIALLPLAFTDLDDPAPMAAALSGLLTIATLPVLPYMISALIGDQAMTLKTAFTRGWWPALRILLFTALILVPLQYVHMQNHYLAMGQSQGIVWLLMIWDSILVGALAAWMGTAMHHGYHSFDTQAQSR